MSPLVFAHVRAAYPGMPVSEQNCHPFQWGRYMWMHNGVVGGFMKIRRALLASLSDAAYDTVQVRDGLLLCIGSRAGTAGTVLLRNGDCCRPLCWMLPCPQCKHADPGHQQGWHHVAQAACPVGLSSGTTEHLTCHPGFGRGRFWGKWAAGQTSQQPFCCGCLCLVNMLPSCTDGCSAAVQSFHSDSAVCFAIFLNHLPDLTPHHSPQVLLKAMEVRDCTATQHLPAHNSRPAAAVLLCLAALGSSYPI